ncbi:uncharacterized protein LOC129941241 [Eupeodes corollae]|uniref:uncharacterized protein LOC129941241 n=1 Tax=Eupeodes corollae TaxID=290404 RepID=UPI002490DBA5|nr:uncharacterized protein LOC129941241 [Eupeodes corollae]
MSFEENKTNSSNDNLDIRSIPPIEENEKNEIPITKSVSKHSIDQNCPEQNKINSCNDNSDIRSIPPIEENEKNEIPITKSVSKHSIDQNCPEQNKIYSCNDNCNDILSIPPIKENEKNEIPITKSVSKHSIDQNFPEQQTKSISSFPKPPSLVSSNSSLESQIPPRLKSSDSTDILALEKEYESLQMAFFALTSQFAKVQFRLRQIIQARPDERDNLLAELTYVAFCGMDDETELANSMPQMKKDLQSMGNIRRRQGYLIDRLRSQLEQLSEKCCCRKKSVRICEHTKGEHTEE